MRNTVTNTNYKYNRLILVIVILIIVASVSYITHLQFTLYFLQAAVC